MDDSRRTSAGTGIQAPSISRRRFTSSLLLGAGALAAGLAPGRAAAAPIYLSAFDQQRYFTYPHQNGFFDGGRKVVLGQIDGPGRSSLWVHDIAAERSRKLAAFTRADGRDFVYYDIAESRLLLVTSDVRSLWTIDLADGSPAPRRLFTAPAGHELDDIVSISHDASTVLAAYRPIGRNYPTTVVRVRVSDGRATFLFQKGFRANHLQHSPHDPTWFGFSRDQGNTDRIWGHHPTAAPTGRLLWSQRSPTGGELRVGHEVWCRHDLSILVIAYPSSPGGPRGLYQVRPDGSSRLVQASDSYSHCNVRRDGRYAVVDAGSGAVILIDMTGRIRPRQLADTRFAPHPRHPHPHFTPDGSKVIYNDTDASRRVRVAMVPIG